MKSLGTDQLVLFVYAQTDLNADAMIEFHSHNCNKGLLPTILLCMVTGLRKRTQDHLKWVKEWITLYLFDKTLFVRESGNGNHEIQVLYEIKLKLQHFLI